MRAHTLKQVIESIDSVNPLWKKAFEKEYNVKVKEFIPIPYVRENGIILRFVKEMVKSKLSRQEFCEQSGYKKFDFGYIPAPSKRGTISICLIDPFWYEKTEKK